MTCRLVAAPILTRAGLADGGDVLGRFAISTASAWSVCLWSGTSVPVVGDVWGRFGTGLAGGRRRAGGAVVLTVAKVTQSAAGGYAEYLHGRADQGVLGDYYLRDGMRVEAPGRWVQGAGSVGSDPSVAVSGEELRELMAARRPFTGKPLRGGGGTGQAVAAIDATFSAPKSVSAVWALSPVDERLRIEAAHERGIDRAVEYAVESVAMIRERVDQQTVIHGRPAGMVATSWRHTTARAVEGRPADPQLHSHVLLHAAVREDGRVVAIDSRSWLVHRRELGAAYRTELARELGQLGYRITRGTGRGRRYFELDGVPAALLDRWSSRHHQVQTAINLRLREQHARLEQRISAGGPDAAQAAEHLKLLREYGQLAPRQERHMASLTRSAKNELLTRRDLDRAWRRTADEFGFARVRTVKRADADRPLADPAGSEEILGRLTEFDATFCDRDARAVAFEASAGASIQDTLDRLEQLRDTGELLGLADGMETTRAHRQAERETAGLAERVATRRVKSMPSVLVADQALALDVELKARSGAGLSPAQRDALELACSNAQLTVIEGQAGTGKSTVLAGVARAHQAAGQAIIVTSTAALAAGRLSADLEAAGVDASSYSTAALHTAIETGRLELTRETTVIHDEAALASTRELHQLLAAVEESGARLILIGDPKQSQAVGAGGLWPRIERAARDNAGRIELTENCGRKTRTTATRRNCSVTAITNKPSATTVAAGE
jgi:conjugative relaxase-like TrwC/TraI family protein